MATNLHIELHPTYLQAVVTGIFSVPNAKDALAQILMRCEAHRLPLTLVDWRQMTLPAPMATLDQFDIASFLADQVNRLRARGMSGVRVAFLKAASQLDPERFIETVASNRGIDLKTTSDMAEALAWLGVEPTDDRDRAGKDT